MQSVQCYEERPAWGADEGSRSIAVPLPPWGREGGEFGESWQATGAPDVCRDGGVGWWCRRWGRPTSRTVRLVAHCKRRRVPNNRNSPVRYVRGSCDQWTKQHARPATSQSDRTTQPPHIHSTQYKMPTMSLHPRQVVRSHSAGMCTSSQHCSPSAFAFAGAPAGLCSRISSLKKGP